MMETLEAAAEDHRVYKGMFMFIFVAFLVASLGDYPVAAKMLSLPFLAAGMLASGHEYLRLCPDRTGEWEFSEMEAMQD